MTQDHDRDYDPLSPGPPEVQGLLPLPDPSHQRLRVFAATVGQALHARELRAPGSLTLLSTLLFQTRPLRRPWPTKRWGANSELEAKLANEKGGCGPGSGD